MIPVLPPNADLSPTVMAFSDELRRGGFRGDLSSTLADRMALATDNSIFQIRPEMVIHPVDEKDVMLVMKTLGRAEFREVHLTPRGGGTGTNGQSLNHGVILDLSRHMTDILEIDPEAKTARVQPGVVLDQLNRALKAHGLFFSPAVSTSSRATLGGMANNDSSGKGSLVYGKTSDHVLSMNTVLSDGSLLKSESALDDGEMMGLMARQDRVGEVYRTVNEVVRSQADEIERIFPKMNRFMSGYNLAHVLKSDGAFRLNYLLCGSEGTLGVTTELLLNLTPIPTHSRVVAIMYSDFDSALRCAYALASTHPEAVETIDDKIMSMARQDEVWHRVAHLMDRDPGQAPVKAVNFVEYVGMEPESVNRSIEALVEQLEQEAFAGVVGHVLADDPVDMAALWELRKKGVGLLGAVKGSRKPMAFVEDTAVPPENLADFIAEFHALLHHRGLDFGMFGHVDAGCMHVRPALDLTVPEDVAQVADISNEVSSLVRKYGGVLWGEHGRGIRSEYTEDFFGPVLYENLRRIKGAFDPNNQLNPGKMVTPLSLPDATYRITETSLRGDSDAEIPVHVREAFPSAMNCNGNGACHNVDPKDVMCPSSKITKDRVHSPKGRAGLMREWLKRVEAQGGDPNTRRSSWTTKLGSVLPSSKVAQKEDDFNHQVYDAMMGCLSCKACTSQCPIHVDIPSLKARFLSAYHTRYRHPIKDHLVAGLEHVAPLVSGVGQAANAVQKLGPVKWLVEKVGLVDAPSFSSPTLKSSLQSRTLPDFNLHDLKALPDEEKARTIVLVQDAFTSYFDAQLVIDTIDFFQAIGVRVVVAPYRANGKPEHIKGFLDRFERTAKEQADFLDACAETGIALVGIEPSVVLTYREEYPEFLGKALQAKVHLPQEWLTTHLKGSSHWPNRVESGRDLLYRLYSHCTEKTSEQKSPLLWKEAFAAFGLHLEIEKTGCCGMAGTFGHETQHRAESKGIYQQNWKQSISQALEKGEIILGTGYSCRSQVKRFEDRVMLHPMSALRMALLI